MIGILVFAVSIVLPGMPTVIESFAAKELKYHLEKATGETVSIVAEGESVGRDDPIAPFAEFVWFCNCLCVILADNAKGAN